MEQLCLNLGTVPFEHGKRSVRSIPPIVSELFELSDDVPSGLVWKNRTPNGRREAGSMAGSLMAERTNKFQVSVRGHGLYYAHRIAYYLQHGEDPGSMLVRHLHDGSLALGWQADNGRDVKGTKKKEKQGYTTGVMYTYRGVTFNLKKLCELLDLNYSSVYQKLHRTKAGYSAIFACYGIHGVERKLRGES
jgi:hypothetical protein